MLLNLCCSRAYRLDPAPALLRKSSNISPGHCLLSMSLAGLCSAWRALKLCIVCRGRLFIIKALQPATLHLFSKNALDTEHHWFVLRGNEREGITGLRSPACTPYPVRVRVGGIGHIKVNDMGYA